VTGTAIHLISVPSPIMAHVELLKFKVSANKKQYMYIVFGWLLRRTQKGPFIHVDTL